MPSYVVTGASKGLGFGFLKALSEDPSNTVIGFVRDLPAAKEIVAQSLPGRTNLHLVQGDIGNYESMKSAAAETSKITNGSLDVLIANAAYQSLLLALDPISTVYNANDPDLLAHDLVKSFEINAVGNIHLFNLLLPLLLLGTTKKAVAISTGMADIDLVAKFDIDVAAPYAISKAALNLAVAKFHAEYNKDGLLFMSISPGVVATDILSTVSPENMHKMGALGAKFAAYAPDFKGPAQVEDSVRDVLAVVEAATIEKNGGIMVSHLGNQIWL